ncbi:hypothetical protein ACJJTC_019192 [Scirpophaga incertulas]
MDNSQEQPKRNYCARCFLPIDTEDLIGIEGQNFHRFCSMCCICRNIPKSLKVFYGQVFCSDCFKTHMVSQFRGDCPRIYTNSWWMQWGPDTQIKDGFKDQCEDKNDTTKLEDNKRCICTRCLQFLNNADKFEIGGQNFHAQCARCYFCHSVPTTKVKIYYGQVFCEHCFNRYILHQSRDNPADFFKNCFEQWQSNAQFADGMKDFMASKNVAPPFVFMMGQPPFCRCEPAQGFVPPSDTKKSATATSTSSTEYGLEANGSQPLTDPKHASNLSNNVMRSTNTTNAIAAEKIEKWTKYLDERMNNSEKEKKWKMYDPELLRGWVNLQGPKSNKICPKCLWQCGTIYVNGDLKVCCGDR